MSVTDHELLLIEDYMKYFISFIFLLNWIIFSVNINFWLNANVPVRNPKQAGSRVYYIRVWNKWNIRATKGQCSLKIYFNSYWGSLPLFMIPVCENNNNGGGTFMDMIMSYGKLSLIKKKNLPVYKNSFFLCWFFLSSFPFSVLSSFLYSFTPFRSPFFYFFFFFLSI